MSKPILFFGNERLATGVKTSAPTLQALITTGYEVTAVVVAQQLGGKSRQERELEVESVANQHGIPLLSFTDLLKAREELAQYGAEAAVLVAYGQIIPQAVLDLFPKGIINVHPSLLPRHRGPAPIESVILQGETETGVSLMRLAAKMDSGPLYAQESIELSGNEAKQDLADKLSLLGSQMVVKHLPAILDGSLQPFTQDESKATYDKLISKDDSLLDWSKPAEVLEREIRAYAGWPRSRATLGTAEVIITKAHVNEGQGDLGSLLIDKQQLGIYTAKGVLAIDSLIPAGKKEMPASAFLAGYNLA